MFRYPIRLLVLALSLLSVLTTWGGALTAHAQTPSTYSNDSVRKVIVAGKIRAHLAMSYADWGAGDYALSSEHLQQLSDELLSIISADLKKANLLDTFQRQLEVCAALTGQPGDKQQVEAAFQQLTETLNQAALSFAPVDAFKDAAFNLTVQQGLLGAVVEEYGESINAGKIIKSISYQNALGFYRVAHEGYTAQTQKTVQAQYAALDAEIVRQYAILESAFPTIQPPEKPLDPKIIEDAVNAVKAAVSGTLKIDLEAKRSVPEVIAAARTGLLDALDSYSGGKADDAYEQASSAYLDNFEGLETALRKKDAALTDTLEKQFVDFGKQIKDGKPLDDLKALYTQIDTNLGKAQDSLTAP